MKQANSNKIKFPVRVQSRRIYKSTTCDGTFGLSSCSQLDEENISGFKVRVRAFAHSIGYNCIYVHLCECGYAVLKHASAFMYNFSIYPVTCSLVLGFIK